MGHGQLGVACSEVCQVGVACSEGCGVDQVGVACSEGCGVSLHCILVVKWVWQSS